MKITCEVCGGPTFEPAVNQPDSSFLTKVKCDEKNKKACHLWQAYISVN